LTDTGVRYFDQGGQPLVPRVTIVGMSRAPIHTTTKRRALNPGVEYEFHRMTISREFSRNFVARLLTERAERDGWELDRVRLFPDGTRKIVLRRKIIRQTRPSYLSL
jgi:hypothetical protein